MVNYTKDIEIMNVKIDNGTGKNGRPYTRYTLLGKDRIFYTLFENPRNKGIEKQIIKGKILHAVIDSSKPGNPLITAIEGLSTPAKQPYTPPTAKAVLTLSSGKEVVQPDEPEVPLHKPLDFDETL